MFINTNRDHQLRCDCLRFQVHWFGDLEEKSSTQRWLMKEAPKNGSVRALRLCKKRATLNFLVYWSQTRWFWFIKSSHIASQPEEVKEEQSSIKIQISIGTQMRAASGTFSSVTIWACSSRRTNCITFCAFRDSQILLLSSVEEISLDGTI